MSNISEKRITREELMKHARSKVCLPLDKIASISELRERVCELSPVAGLFKVGKGSFTRFGFDAINSVHRFGAGVFLDLKYHDIPATVRDAAYAATQQGIYMFNVHAMGGKKMMEAAVEGATKASEDYDIRKPKIVGVTILTSIDQAMMNDEMRIPGGVEDQVLHLALLSKSAGLDGVVCSAADLRAIRSHLPHDFMYVTPGIKGTTTPAGDDQKRVFSPGNAVRAGSSILVVGRAITDQPTPEARLQAGYEILQDMARYI
ncbi:orotidine-5'-phosphate decarboxylase [Candidatus Woesearchaeota archaeon]|nr:orotidine-5'-phosphate decarboxylase [Candidatus Woesearchaeota archaeon]